jgi:glycosyltransferase involved in cell wall biosynthesis
MWQGQSVSVILPTCDEKVPIAQCVRDFHATDVVDEVLVINDNAVPGTSEEVAKTPRRASPR